MSARWSLRVRMRFCDPPLTGFPSPAMSAPVLQRVLAVLTSCKTGLCHIDCPTWSSGQFHAADSDSCAI